MSKYRTQQRPSDANKLDYLQKNIPLPIIREQTLHNEKYTQSRKERTPDLIINKRVILEHDTFKIHGELSDPNERTIKRNHDHVVSGFPFCVIHEDLAKMLGLDEAKLATYLYYHSVMLWNSFMEAKII